MFQFDLGHFHGAEVSTNLGGTQCDFRFDLFFNFSFSFPVFSCSFILVFFIFSF